MGTIKVIHKINEVENNTSRNIIFLFHFIFFLATSLFFSFHPDMFISSAIYVALFVSYMLNLKWCSTKMEYEVEHLIIDKKEVGKNVQSKDRGAGRLSPGSSRGRKKSR